MKNGLKEEIGRKGPCNLLPSRLNLSSPLVDTWGLSNEEE